MFKRVIQTSYSTSTSWKRNSGNDHLSQPVQAEEKSLNNIAFKQILEQSFERDNLSHNLMMDSQEITSS